MWVFAYDANKYGIIVTFDQLKAVLYNPDKGRCSDFSVKNILFMKNKEITFKMNVHGISFISAMYIQIIFVS